jgi:DNA uptake protein ComE-like DNA-binding protein
MKDRIKDYFAFNKKEQRGLIILLVLMLLSISVNIFLPEMMPEKEFDITPFQKEVTEFLASAAKRDSLEKLKPQRFTGDLKKDAKPLLEAFRTSPFYFDPNDVSEEKWMEMGMKESLARNIIRYREKGGTFRDKEGFSKIYGMDDSMFTILSPYMRFPQPVKESSTYSYKYNDKNDSTFQGKTYPKYKPDTILLELNSTDSALLLSCRGIGPSFAGKIIKYRDQLGGYVTTKQLLEVKGMDTLRFNQFKNQVMVNPGLVKKIDLNQATFKEMLRHPYFEYYLVKAVFNYKDEIKAFDSIGQLRSIPVMYGELYEKIAPYLVVE